MRYLLSVLAIVTASNAAASTPAAWDQLDTRVRRACVAASGLARPVLLARKISFSDAIGVEMRMVRGIDRRGRMTRLLCAYHRATGRTEVQGADDWHGPTVTP